MYPSQLRTFVKHNVLTTAEAAEILQITKQRVINMAKSNEIIPVKQTTQGFLFLRADIEAYKKERDYGINISRLNFKPIFDYSGSTNRSLNFYYDNIGKLGEIVSVFIFFEEYDAALENFYIPSEEERYGELKYIDCPYFILRDVNGAELWLGACNCGYGGEGPNGSIEILKDLRKNHNINISDEEIESIKYNRIVKIFKESNGKTEFITHNSPLEEWQAINSTDLDLYYFRNNLVLIEDPDSMWNKNSMSDLSKYKDFIPNPIQVKIFLTHEQAKNEGYVMHAKRFQEKAYRLIIFDSSGRQIWLDPLISDTKPLYYQNDLVELIRACGFDVKEENLTEKIHRWLKVNVRKLPIEPIVINNNNN